MKLTHLAADRRFRLARLWSNDELRKVARYFSGRIVNVSAWKDSDKDGATYQTYFTGATSYHRTNYKEGRGFQGIEDEILLDLTDTLPKELEGAFDVVFNHTTLEHIFEVNTAFDNMCAMSNDVVILVLPFAQVQHETGSWKDYWRFTPSWVNEAFRRKGFEVLYISSNNDKNAAVYVFAVASRNPDKWRGQLPTSPPKTMAAEWLGHSLWRKVIAFGKSKVATSGSGDDGSH